MTAAAAAAGAAPNRRRGHEAARRAKRDEELEEGLDDEEHDEEHDEHDDARERTPEPRMAATVARANDGLRRMNRLPSKARLTTIVLLTMRNMKTQEAP